VASLKHGGGAAGADANGVIHLTDRKPARGIGYEVVLRSRGPLTPAPDPETVQHILDEIKAAAQRYGVDEHLVKAVARVESNFNPKAVSVSGAVGVMQLIPSTAKRYGVSNSFDYKQNIDGGTRYLRELLKMFDGDIRNAVAAYNAGEGNVLKHGGIPPIQETRAFVAMVSDYYEHYSGRSVAPPGPVRARPPVAGHGHKRPVRQYTDSRGVIHLTNR